MSLTDIDFLILKKKLDLLEDRLFSLEQEYNRLNYYTEQDIKKSPTPIPEEELQNHQQPTGSLPGGLSFASQAAAPVLGDSDPV